MKISFVINNVIASITDSSQHHKLNALTAFKLTFQILYAQNI